MRLIVQVTLRKVIRFLVGIRHHATMEFNRRLAASSMGLLPDPDETKARYASLAGSHTVAGMRCVLAGTPHERKGSKLTVNGCFNINLVEKADMGYANACRNGLTPDFCSPSLALLHLPLLRQPVRKRSPV